MRTAMFALAFGMLAGLAGCDGPAEQKAGSAPASESKDGGKSSGVKTDAPTVIRSPDNPYQ